jgi:hypothetical protein
MPEIPSAAQKPLALWGAADPSDRRDTRDDGLHAIAAKWRQGIEFVELH